jgi:tetraacyldisaccharide 4'-kinase
MQELRKLLLPLSWVYGFILNVRHKLYDKKILKSYKPSQKTLVVGNLALGGTGKTPMVDYLVNLLGEKEVAVLSRGYGRKTKGSFLVKINSTAEECGDEPLLLKQNHPGLLVLVDEDRTRGLKFLKENHPLIKTVILDDAMQHRKVKADFYLLLTTWSAPFTSDYLLPVGNLRDIKSRSKISRAIIVTKTNPNASKEEKEKLRNKLRKGNQRVFFSSISYENIYSLAGKEFDLPLHSKIVLVSGIANPDPFEKEAQIRFDVVRHFEFRDHHPFTMEELFKLRDFIDTFEPQKPKVLTTEKDAKRLKGFESFFIENQIEVYFWKISTDFGADTDNFNSMIRSI